MLEKQYFRKGLVCGGGGGGGCVTLSLEEQQQDRSSHAMRAACGAPALLPPWPHPGNEREPSAGSCAGALQVPGLFLPALALLAVPPSASSQLEHSWEVSGHITGPSFTA